MTDESWHKTLLTSSATIKDAIASLDESGLQIVLVVNQAEQLIGTITDGDIRRGLLRGLTLADSIDAIVQREPLVVPPNFSRDAVLAIMSANKIFRIPVVDGERRIRGLQSWDSERRADLLGTAMVIMAGGKGTRLRPFTEDCPKPMLEVGSRPMLEHIVLRARREGIRHFVMAINYLGHVIEEHFGDGSRFDVRIEYIREDRPLGTGGALSLLGNVPSGPFIVTNGDVLTDIRYGDLVDFHVAHGSDATMAVRSHEWQHPFGIVHTDGLTITGFEEKPVVHSHVNAGIYVLEPSALECLEINEPCDMPTLFDRLRSEGRTTIVYPMHEPWIDVGRPDDLDNARQIYETH